MLAGSGATQGRTQVGNHVIQHGLRLGSIHTDERSQVGKSVEQ